MVSVALSLGLHAALLGASTRALLSGAPPPGLIHIALTNGRAGGDTAAGDSEAIAPARAAQSPATLVNDTHTQRRPAHAVARRRAQSPAAASFAEAVTDHFAASVGTGVPGAAAMEDGAHGAGSAAGSGTGAGNGIDIDQRAGCVYCPEPRYPLIARARGWQGTVDVGLLVLADGSVDTAKLRRSSGYGILDDAAVAVARQSRFTPPAAHGLAAPLRGCIEYRFELTTSR